MRAGLTNVTRATGLVRLLGSSSTKMPLGELLEPVFQTIGEFIVEVLVKGAGYLIVRYGWRRGRRGTNTESWLVLWVGIAFWLAVGVFAVGAYRHFF
jgi:hypothetical protein